jgi:hypothetical protein
MRLEHPIWCMEHAPPVSITSCTHPNVAPPSLHWSESETLHVAVAYSILAGGTRDASSSMTSGVT